MTRNLAPLSACFCCVLIALASSAQAYESRFGVDPAVNLAQLEESGETIIRSERQNSLYYSDASAVLRVEFDDLDSVSSDYDHYVSYGMPNLKESRTVRHDGSMHLIWTQMEALRVTSRHYLQVELGLMLPEEGRGIRWQLFHPTAADKDLNDPDQSAFNRLEGSWYMLPLGNGRVYVRYFLVGDPKVKLPDWILEGLMKRQFRDGVRDVIQALARAATERLR